MSKAHPELQDLKRALHDWSGVDLTDEQGEELLADPEVARTLGWGFDTVCREAAMRALARRLVGRDWPLYGEGDEVAKAFEAAFQKAAIEKGYKLVAPV